MMIIFFIIETVNDDTYDDPFDFKEEKIKESKLLIDELDLPESNNVLPFPECDSIFYEDFSKVEALSSTDNEDKPGHLAARLECAEMKVATWDDLAFKLIILGRNVKHRILQNVDPWYRIFTKGQKGSQTGQNRERIWKEREKLRPRVQKD
ncbi:hypothetical protein Tco_0291801 [Tanacetum coccineum]